MSARLEYWDATPPSGNPRWTQATISYGSATNNAVLNCDIVERLGTSRQAKVTLMNQGTSFNTVGPFTNEFTDFQRVRILDDDVNVVLFHGRIYDIKVHTDAKFGDVTTIECYDMLRELQEYPTEHFKTPIDYGTNAGQFNKNSILIKNLIASDYAIDSSANVGSGSIVFSDTDRFETSAITLDQDNYPAFYPNRGEKSVLGQVAAIARQDPHSGDTYEDRFGYDYYLDSSFDKTTDYIASSNATLLGDTFNYFKRGTRPSTPGTPGTNGVDWKGLRIHRPTTTFSETGNLIAMLDGSGFEKPKDDLFTSVILQFDETTVASTVGGNYDDLYDYSWGNSWVQPHVASHDGRFLVEGIDGGTFGGSSGGIFQWQGHKFSRLYEVSVNAETANNVAAELIDYTHTHSSGDSSHGDSTNLSAVHGGNQHSHNLGTVVYTSATSGTGLFLITFEQSYMERNFNYFCDTASSTLVLTGQSSNATYTFTPSTHRMKNKFGIQRPYRMQISASKYLDAIRQEAANALSKSVLPQISGRFRTLRAPYYYVDMYASGFPSNDSATISHIKQNSGSFSAVGTPSENTLANWGLKEGMTIAKVNSNGVQTAWGWITDINGAVITADIRDATNDGDVNWSGTGSSNIIRVYIPVRTGHYAYIVNDAQAVNGYHFVEEVGYTETQGAIGTNYKTYGTNVSTYDYEGPFKSKLPQIIVAIDETSKNIGKLHDTPVSLMPWSFTQADGSGETGKFTVVNRTSITWTAGLLDIGGVYKYKIRSGSSGTLSTATTGQMDGLPYEYVISFDNDQTPDGNNTYEIAFTLKKDYIDDVDKIKMGWARAGAAADEDAQFVFDGSVGDFSMKTHLSAISPSLGTLLSGRGIFGTNSGNFNSGASGASSSFTGVAVGEPGTGTNGIGNNFTLRSQVSGVDQVYVESGILKAGTGNVTIDAGGLHLKGEDTTTFNMYDTGGTERYRLRSYSAYIWQNSIGVPTLFAPTSGLKSFAPAANADGYLGYYDTNLSIARGWEALHLGRVAGGLSGTNYGKTIKLEAQAGTSSELTNYTISLPPIPPTGTSQVLQTTGSSPFNELEWASNAGGGGSVTLSGSTNNTVATVTGANALLGESNLTFNGSKLEINGRININSDTAVGAVPTGEYGIFRYTTSGTPGSGDDTLAFATNLQNSTSASNTANSVFWIMQSTGDYLYLEPNLPNGTSNYATIGLTNPLSYIRSYYLQGGNGTAARPSLTFYGNDDNGFWHNASAGSNTISISLAGTEEYQFGPSYFKSLTDANLGSSVDKWGVLYAVNVGTSGNKITTAYIQTLHEGDLFLNNTDHAEGNMFDGTKGHWLIQEGVDDLFIKNILTGKKYKFKLEEIV